MDVLPSSGWEKRSFQIENINVRYKRRRKLPLNIFHTFNQMKKFLSLLLLILVGCSNPEPINIETMLIERDEHVALKGEHRMQIAWK